MRRFIVPTIAMLLVAVSSQTAHAQIKSKIIDTEALVVKPTDTATSIIGGTTRYIGRVVAGTLDNNGIVRTLNNLFGRTDSNAQYNGTISPLPPVSAYPSNYFNSPIKPVMPGVMTIRR